jgi:hypothetical protein
VPKLLSGVEKPMNWDLIPEIFFDVIGRGVPGALFLVGTFAVHFGPTRFAQEVAEILPSANLAFLLLFWLLAYFVAIVLKEVWDLGNAIITRSRVEKFEGDHPRPNPFFSIRMRFPKESSWLLKLQAEKNLCEVLIPGLTLLFFSNACRIAAETSGYLGERTAFATILLMSGFACWQWRKSLEVLYLHNLEILENLGKEKYPDEPGEKEPAR